jgi:ubiquinone/menaquinone biosynthesis C-methylase UbiE
VPSMEEIYKSYSDRYDELVGHEDYQKNLTNWLLSSIEWAGRTVVEAGAGTGRVTEIYAPLAKFATCFDRSEHMLQAARNRLKRYMSKLSFAVAENLDLPELPQARNVFIEGWSFGHTVIDSEQPVEHVAEELLRSACRSLSKDADVFLIETLGTNTSSPKAPAKRLYEFYTTLERKWGFVLKILSTDYLYHTFGDAAKSMGFFFGKGMKESILSAQQAIVPEWTGVWHSKIGKGPLDRLMESDKRK